MKTDDFIARDSPKLSNYPFVYINPMSNELTESEKRNLQIYIKGSGFLVLDIGERYSYATKIIKDFLGEKVKCERIQINHPLYHCFFDFKKVNSQAAESSESFGPGFLGYNGIWAGNKLIGIYGVHVREWWNQSINEINELSIKMSVNMIVYALTR